MRLATHLLAFSLLALLACSGKTEQTQPTPVTPVDDSGNPIVEDSNVIPTEGLELVKGLTINEIAVFQGPKITVMKDGAKNGSRLAPVVANRPGLIRVYVTPAGDWTPREVVAVLTLVTGGATKTLTVKKTITGASADQTLDSTFNFELETDQLGTDAQYAVTLKTATGQTAGGGTEGAEYPAGSAPESIDAQSSGDAFKLVIVPVKYNADGSGRLPDTSEAQIELYRKKFQQLYPARKIEVTVHAPFPWASAISRNGSGFSQILDAILRLRGTDGVGKDVYYYGAFAPAGSIVSFCGGGCVAGLSYSIDSPTEARTRGSVGLGFSGEGTTNTAAHEIGHAQGRLHAPCGGAASVDPKFPYATAKIGPWSYDIENKKLVDPAKVKDYMAYCQPEWTSDYTYNAVFARMKLIAGTSEIEGPARMVRPVYVDGDGKLTWGEAFLTRESMLNDPHTVTYETAEGVTGSVTGHFYPYSHLPGGTLYVPVPNGKLNAIHVDGFGKTSARLAWDK